MQDSSLLLKAVSETEIEKIADLAKIIWQKHYPPIIGQEQVDYMLKNMYNTKSLLNQINEKGQQFYFIIFENETIGFISVTNEKDRCWNRHCDSGRIKKNYPTKKNPLNSKPQ